MSRRSSGTGSALLFLLAFFGVIAAIIASFVFAFMVSSTTALHKVQEAGYSDIHLSGRHVFTAEWRCGKDYIAYFDFTAVAPNGVPVSGRVCKGEPPFQGWTVKFK